MKHYVLGFHFNTQKDRILLVKKLRPDWMAGRWNGIGGKVEEHETPHEAMRRESIEETGIDTVWEHTVTFTCSGGTIFVFVSFTTGDIIFEQKEDELKGIFVVSDPPKTVMSNLLWLIPLSLGNIHFPVLVSQSTLGIN